MKANQVKCTFDGCNATSEQPMADGWAELFRWGPGIKDGLYCKAHADALGALALDGSLDEIQGSRS
jgi:hypothetical protein